ncbi:MAG: CinA family protein [Gammaproteobacteria bacterium]
MNDIEKIANHLIASKQFIAVAESCTGGLLASTLISKSGASGWFKGGIVCYSNEIKQRVLKVEDGILDQFGAVSHEVSKALVLGVVHLMQVEAGIAITGIAGPEGGSQEKPVGLVYISTYFKGEIITKEYRFLGTRTEIRQKAVDESVIQLHNQIIH